MPKKKIAKAVVTKARAIARKVAKAAVGMAIEKRRPAKKKRAKKR